MARNNNNESSAKMKRKNPSRWTVTKEELAGDESSTIPWEGKFNEIVGFYLNKKYFRNESNSKD